MPDEFWVLTPREIRLKFEGFTEMQQATMDRMAWAVAHIMNSSGNMKRPVTVSMLLGKSAEVHRGAANRQEFDRLLKEFGEEVDADEHDSEDDGSDRG